MLVKYTLPSAAEDVPEQPVFIVSQVDFSSRVRSIRENVHPKAKFFEL